MTAVWAGSHSSNSPFEEEHLLDRDVEIVTNSLRSLDPDGKRIAMVIRNTLDQLYDGQHTGRYRWDQLHKTEKTHCGTLIEINLQREMKFTDGLQMDFQIGGIEVDCKYSQSLGGWMIPMEAVGQICLLLWADDERAEWSLGITRMDEHVLGRGANRDSKRTLSATGRQSIRWVFQHAPLPPNVLLQLPRQQVDDIMSLTSGQKRIDEIFRVAQGRIIGRGVIATLGQQDDYMKRVRGNGGSRSRLSSEGILILGHYDEHRRIAKELGLPIPELGELVSVRVVRAGRRGRQTARIQNESWRIANPEDPIETAPDCPHSV